MTELSDEALQQYTSDEIFKELTERNNVLMSELVSKLPKDIAELFDEYMEAKNKRHSIELDFVYRQGLQHSIMLLQYIGFPFYGDKDK